MAESEGGMMMSLTDIELAGRTVLRVGTFTHTQGGETYRRVVMALAWQDDPPFPLGSRCITLPADRLPVLIGELQKLCE